MPRNFSDNSCTTHNNLNTNTANLNNLNNLDEWLYLSDEEDTTDYPREPPKEPPFYFKDKYLYDNVWYHEKFPLSWADYHVKGTGPLECKSCIDYGFVNQTFIGYCVKCADEIYEGQCGRGFVAPGVECDDDICLMYDSAFDIYLKGVNVKKIQPLHDDPDDSLEPPKRMRLDIH